MRPWAKSTPEVLVIKIESMEGELLGVVTNYACHLDTVSGNRYCPDYPGELERVLKRVYGPDVVSIFLTGACGNINHYDFMHRTREFYTRANPPHYVRMGRVLAGAVIKALSFARGRGNRGIGCEKRRFPRRDTDAIRRRGGSG